MNKLQGVSKNTDAVLEEETYQSFEVSSAVPAHINFSWRYGNA